MDASTYLIFFGLFLFVGILLTVLSNKIKISNMLFLLIFGMSVGIFARTYFNFEIPNIFVTSVSLLALIMIVFYSSSRIKVSTLTSPSLIATHLTLLIFVVNLIIITVISYYIFKIPLLLSFFFAILMSGTSPDAVLTVFEGAKSKLIDTIKIESIINTPLVIIIPLLVADFSTKWTVKPADLLSTLGEFGIPFLQQIVGGVGAGFVVGLVFFRFMKKNYSPTLSPLGTIAAVLVTYALALAINGNTILGITTLGLVYSTVYIKAKGEITSFSRVFSMLLEIIVFILVGFIIKFPFTWNFILKSLLMFLIILVIRFLAVYSTFESGDLKEAIFVTLAPSKGVAVAVVVLMLGTYSFAGLQGVIDLSLAIILYSIILSTIVTKFSKFFVKMEVGATNSK